MSNLSPVRRRVLCELLVVVSLFTWSTWWSLTYERAAAAAGVTGAFYQNYFEPSVLLACGHGFTLTSPERSVPALNAFLETRAETFDCAALPSAIRTTTNGVFYSWLYLMLAVALTWKVLGVAWSSLMLLLAVLFGFVVVLAYGLCRLGVGRILSAACALALSVSTLHLTNLPNLRDYAKAPFVLALILLLGWLVTGAGSSARRVLIISGIYGVVLGIGYGFRTDLLINIPPFLITLFGFLPGGLWKRIRLKLAAASLCLLAFALSAWPLLRYVSAHGSCQWHIVLLGMTTQFDAPLGISPAAYDWGHNYADSYVYSSIGGFPSRGGNGDHGPYYCSPEYDAITAGYVLRLATTFPADFVTRAYASVLRISNLPFEVRTAPLEAYRGRFYDRRGRTLERLRYAGPFLVVIASAIIAAQDLRLGLWALFMLLFVGGYPMLQFQPRHHFHLEWIGWFAGALTVSTVLHGGRSMLSGPIDRSIAKVTPTTVLNRAGVIRRLLLWGLVAGGVTYGLVWPLRYYQQRRVHGVIETMIAETTQPVVTVRDVGEQGRILLRPTDASLLAPAQRQAFWGEFLRIELDGTACGSPPSVTLRYDPVDPDHNFSRAIPLPAKAVTVLAPVFQKFVGVEVVGDAAGCVTAIYHPRNVAAIPIWLFAVLPHDRSGVKLYQSIRPSLVSPSTLWP